MASPTTKYLHSAAPLTDRGASPPEQTGPRTTELSPARDLVDYFREYAREKPEVVALWCLGIGFVLGWKLKPW
jgi:hypothetical protein